MKRSIKGAGPSLAFSAVLGLSFLYFMRYSEVYMDDVFVYLRVVRNMLGGLGPVMNAGDTRLMVTSPLWLFMVFAGCKLSGAGVIVVSKSLFAVFLAFSSYFVYRLSLRYAGYWAALAPLPLFFNSITLTSVGGEIALAYFALFGMLWAYIEKKDLILVSIFATVGFLARGETVLLIPVFFLHYHYLVRREPGEGRGMHFTSRSLLLPAVIFLLSVSAWYIYYVSAFGTIIPSTLKVKSVQGFSGLYRYFHGEKAWFMPYSLGVFAHLMSAYGRIPLMAILTFAGMYWMRRFGLMFAAFTIIHYVVYSLLFVPNYHWYYYDFYALISVFTIFGAVYAVRFIFGNLAPSGATGRLSRTLLAGLQLVAVAASLYAVTGVFKLGGSNVAHERYYAYKAAAEWINENSGESDVVLSPEVGILSYFLDKAVIRDINGIATPGVTLENINDYDYFVARYKPEFIIYLMDEQPETRHFKTDSGVLEYGKSFVADSTGKYKTTIFRRIESPGDSPGNE